MPDASLQGPHRLPRSGTAKQLVIILHGWGADGPNLIDLAEVMGEALPDAYFIAPNAPEVCEANPYGFQWFSLMDRNPIALLAGARKASEIMGRFVSAKLDELKLDESAVALVGFSQGTMTALHFALRHTPSVACVAGFSGALIGAETLSAETKSRPPICLIHGEADEVVPFASLARAEAGLKAASVPVEIHGRPHLSHSIDMEGMTIATRFLKKHLP